MRRLWATAGPCPPPIPEEAKSLVVLDAQADKEKIASAVDFIFCAVDMKKEEIRALEEAYAKLECPVVSNNSAHRWTPDVPMVIPGGEPGTFGGSGGAEGPAGHQAGLHCGEVQLLHQSYAPALHPLRSYGLSGCWCAPIRRFQAQARPLRLGRKS